MISPGQNSNVSEQEKMLEMRRLLSMATDIECEECKNKNFVEVYRIKHLSGLATGTGKDSIIPMPVFACSDCGHINSVFLPSIGENPSTDENRASGPILFDGN